MSGAKQIDRAWAPLDVPAAVLISLAVQTTISLFAAAIAVLAPAIAAERGWDTAAIALYPLVVYITALAISFQVPALLARMGGMGLSLASVAVGGLGMLMLLPPHAAASVLAAVAIGCTTGAMNPASAQVLGPRTTAQNAGLIMSIKQTGVPLGGVAAGALVPLLVLHFGWRMAALELAALGAALAVVLLPTVRWLNGAARAKPGAFRPLDPVKRLVALPGMLALLLASVAFNGMQLVLRSFFTIYLVADQRFGLAAAGLAFSVSQGAGVVGQLLWAALSDRVLPVHAVMAIVGALMTGAALCTAAMTPHWPLGAIVAVAAAYGLGAAGYLPVLLAEVARRAPRGETGALTSGAQLFPLGGSIIGPLAFGGMASLLGMQAGFVLAAACTFAGTLILAVPFPVLSHKEQMRDHSQ